MSEDQNPRLLRMERRMMQMQDEFNALKVLLEKNNTNLEEFIDLAKAFKFGMKILGFVERAAVFITKLSLAGGTVWAVWKFAIQQAIAHTFRK